MISFLQDIHRASIKPRLRIMAEAKNEGNPHGKLYNIPERSFDLIVKLDEGEDVRREMAGLPAFEIKHRNNGYFF